MFTGSGDQLPTFQKRKKPMVKEELMLPAEDSHMHNVYAYLLKTRKIKKEVVQFL